MRVSVGRLLTAAIVNASLMMASASGNDTPNTTLRQLQAKEALGQPVDRTTHSNLQSPQDHWAVGKVKLGKQWKDLKELSTESTDLSKYHQQRDIATTDIDSQLALASWCDRHGLRDQAISHYYAVLNVDPNNQIARQRLEHRWQNDRWFTKRELQAAKTESQQIARQLESWTPRIKDILQKLKSNNTQQKLAALKALEGIDQEDAIPAMELAVKTVDRQLALPLVKKIGDFRTTEACRALLSFAIGEPTSPITQTAIEQLKGFPEALVVPELLSALSMPIEVSANIVGLPNGRLAMTTLVSRELKDQKQVVRSENQYRIVSSFVATATDAPRAGGGQLNRQAIEATIVSAQYVPTEVFNSARKNLSEQADLLKREAEAENQRIARDSARVYAVLRGVTGQEFEDSPRPWWDWWGHRNEKYVSAKAKPLAQRNYYEEQGLGTDTQAYRQTPLARMFHGCLVAGTTVQTQTGLRPVDEIQVGDLVVSQDVESGELTLKPVIRTTRGEDRPIVAITTEHETIKATPSHFWWVAGHGWKRSCELVEGMHLHTATGTVAVKGTQEDESQPTFNLVVDEYHTYFVGPDRILSYDVMPLKGSLRVVPGYDQIN